MRPRFLISFLLLLSTSLFAEELSVKVIGPDDRPVPNARVIIYASDNGAAVAAASTAGNGEAKLAVDGGRHEVQVLAPGFARASIDASSPNEKQIAVQLKIAGPSQTVQVTATGTPIETAQSGADVTTVDDSVFANQQPISFSDLLRPLPGAVLNASGQRGALTALFVRGGESRYNKVIVDGVPVNEIGGQYNFGTTSLVGADRIEFMRGAQSTLYGSDAMTSVVQIFSAEGRTRVPELRFGADGGTFDTARGYASLAGAISRFDYNVFGEQFNTEGNGPNDDFWLASQGGNIGVALTPKLALRFRARHGNSRVGVQNQWVFGGVPQLPPDLGEFARENNFLSSLELSYVQSPHWRHRLTGFEYNHRRFNADNIEDPGRALVFDDPFFIRDHQNRAGFNHQSEWSPRGWLRTTFGFDLEDENGIIVEDFDGFGAQVRGNRVNYGGYLEQIVVWKRFTATGGVRVLHNGSFGNRAVPRVSLSFLAAQGGQVFSGTRLRFTYAQGFKEPTFEESFGVGAFGIIPNTDLKPEENRSFEAGVEQQFAGGKYSVTATYFNNHFRNLVVSQSLPNFQSQYINLNRTMAHGAEIGFHARLRNSIRLDTSYVYDSAQILDSQASDPTKLPGRPLLRRPKHAGSLLLNYFGRRWGSNLSGSLIGRRPDSDFLFGAVPPVDHTAGYALVGIGGWYAVNHFVTAYANVENVLNRRYEEVAGYPGLKANFRAGLRFRFGGE